MPIFGKFLRLKYKQFENHKKCGPQAKLFYISSLKMTKKTFGGGIPLEKNYFVGGGIKIWRGDSQKFRVGAGSPRPLPI